MEELEKAIARGSNNLRFVESTQELRLPVITLEQSPAWTRKRAERERIIAFMTSD